MLSDGPTAAATAVSVLAVIPVSLLACVLWRLTIIVRALEKLQEAELSRIAATSPSPSGLRHHKASKGEVTHGSCGEAAGPDQWSQWCGHWVCVDAENEKADESLAVQGVPFVIRKVLLRWTPERKFVVDADGHLVFMSRTLAGGWKRLCAKDGAVRAAARPESASATALSCRVAHPLACPGATQTHVEHYFGYEMRAVMSWDGDTLVSTTTTTSKRACRGPTARPRCRWGGRRGRGARTRR